MKHWIAVGLVTVLAACSGNEGASKSQLSKAIDNYNRDHPFCVPVQAALATQAGNTAHLIKGSLGDEWVHVTKEDPNGDDINEAAQKQMKNLTRSGLYEKGSSKEQKALLGENLAAPVDSYHLTKKGQEHFRRVGAQGNVMCIGYVKVDKISWFTEPTPSNGMVVTQVRYTPEYRLESFAKKLIDENMPQLKQQLDKQSEVSTTLVKTNSGWRDARELSEGLR